MKFVNEKIAIQSLSIIYCNNRQQITFSSTEFPYVSTFFRWSYQTTIRSPNHLKKHNVRCNIFSKSSITQNIMSNLYRFSESMKHILIRKRRNKLFAQKFKYLTLFLHDFWFKGLQTMYTSTFKISIFDLINRILLSLNKMKIIIKSSNIQCP